MSYWDGYFLSIPVRKFLIQQYNKQIEEENKQANKKSNSNNKDSYIPLTPREQTAFKNKDETTPNSADFMGSMKNK